LHGTLRLLLPYDGSGGNAITMTDIMDAQAHKVAGAQFAIDVTLPRFHVHQNFDSFLMDGGNNGKERSGSESAVHRGVQN